MVRIRFLFVVCFSFLLVSCFSIKPQVTKTAGNSWEEFYVSSGVMQYFIKPLSFNNQKQKIDIDFTFRNVSDSVIINYSIFSDKGYTKPEIVFISNELTSIKISNQKTIFSEIIKEQFKIRQTGKISLAEFKTLTQNNIWKISVQNQHEMNRFYGSNKTKKKINAINEILLIPVIS